MGSGFRQGTPFRTPSTTVCTAGRPQVGPQSPIARTGDNDASKDGDCDEQRANSEAWPLVFHVSSTAREFDEEAVLIQRGSPFAGEGTERGRRVAEEREVALWCPQTEHHWLLEESESSQRSVASCRTQTARTTMPPSDPGAPTKKNRDYAYICGEAEDLSVISSRPALYRHLDFFYGNSNSVSLACESSVPSHITPLEEAGESVDLTDYMSRLVIASSPARKKLFFAAAAAEDSADATENSGGALQPTRPQHLHRGKRLFEELDVNRDAVALNSSAAAVARETHRKCRRVDGGENDRSDDVVCVVSQGRHRHC